MMAHGRQVQAAIQCLEYLAIKEQACVQGRQGIRCPTAQDRPYVVKNHILHEVPLLPTKYGGSREDNSNKTRNLRCYSNRA
ncbi:hypothetical protein ACLKA7_007731 [Drosophila subpalustris]